MNLGEINLFSIEKKVIFKNFPIKEKTWWKNEKKTLGNNNFSAHWISSKYSQISGMLVSRKSKIFGRILRNRVLSEWGKIFQQSNYGPTKKASLVTKILTLLAFKSHYILLRSLNIKFMISELNSIQLITQLSRYLSKFPREKV